MSSTKESWIKRKANGNGTPWNKGRKLPLLSEEHKEKIRLSLMGNKRRLGTKHSEETKKKIGESHSGEKAYQWKGGINRSIKRRMKIYNSEGSHTKTEWDAMKKKYNYMCLCCKQQEPFIKLCEDHIVPLAVGGSNFITNIQPLCKSCNSRKGIKTIFYSDQVTVA